MMARKNLDFNTSKSPDKHQKLNNNNNNNTNSNCNLKKTPSPRVRSPETRTSPRQSPGLIAGHYAGCKWSEPPSPSTLPTPPQHWMQQQNASPATSLSTITPVVTAHLDIASQLKVLLKVQA